MALYEAEWADFPLDTSTAQKFIPPKIIGEIGQSHICLGADESDAAYSKTVHMTGHEPKDMFDSYPDMGFLFVTSLLLLAQRMVPVPGFVDLILDP